jgi:cobalt-zinc-cadmium efflux system outer membrane protein
MIRFRAGGLVRAWPPFIAALCLTCLAGAGCARYYPAPISTEATLDSFESRRLDDSTFGEFLRGRQEVTDWPPPGWDLRLVTLAAFYYSPVLDVARAQAAVAEGGVVTAGGRANPTLTAGIGYNATTPTSQVTPWIPEALLAIPIDLAGKRGIRISQAQQLSESARLNILTTAWQVRGRVRRAFLDLYAATTSDSLLQLQRELQAEIVRILEAQRGAGEVSPYEVTQGRVALANSRLAALDAGQRRAQARSALADAIGVSPPALDSLRYSFGDLDRPSVDLPTLEIRRRALVNRSDVRAALAEYEASQEALKLEIRKQYPELTLGPAYQLDQTDSKWSLSLSLPLMIFNRNQGPIAEAKARREEVAARFLALQSQVLAELDGAMASARLVVAQVGATDTLLASLQRQERINEAAWQAGEISRLQLLGVRIELVQTALGRLDAVTRAQAAVGALEDAMQSPIDMEQWALRTPERAVGTTPEAKKRDQP